MIRKLSLAVNNSRSIEKRILDRFYRPLVKWYVSRKRNFQYKGIKLQIWPGVFHPGLYFSTMLFLDFLENVPLNQKRVLDLGTGSGLLGIAAFRKGANVLSTDINAEAVKNAAWNFQLNFNSLQQNDTSIEFLQSDLFENIPENKFDYILINPPYFKGAIDKPADYAWYCGEDYEYYKKLFSQIKRYMDAETKAWMILSDQAPLHDIEVIGKSNGFKLKEIRKKRTRIETHVIFQIEHIDLI